MPDTINHPAHYTAGVIECIDAIAAATEGLNGIEAVCTANAIKYLWRWKRKNGAEDLKKAIWYIERLLQDVKPVPEHEDCAGCKYEDKNYNESPRKLCSCVRGGAGTRDLYETKEDNNG